MLNHPREAELFAVALNVRENAYAPWSRFRVGAAILTGSGKIFGGCNVENASFSLTCCAERVAMFSAVAAGETTLAAVLVLTDTHPPASPCGACRQVLHEFGPDATVLIANLEGVQQVSNMRELLPDSFGPESLRRAQG